MNVLYLELLKINAFAGLMIVCGIGIGIVIERKRQEKDPPKA